MKLSIIDPNTMKIEHDGNQPIICSIREFSKTKFITTDAQKNIIDPFAEINAFMDVCLKRSQKDEVFRCYQDIFDEFSIKSLDVDILFKCINENLIKIYDIIRVEDIQDFMTKNNLFNIPADIKEEFTGEYDESRTYNRAKYEGLVSLAIAGRMPIPAWGEFSLIRKSTIGSNMLPIPLMKMLIGCSILESPQFADYELYSISTVEAGTHAPELVAGGLGTEFNININLAANFVKKVAIGLNVASNPLAQNIYNFTANRGAYNDASGGDLIWTKTDMGQEEEKSKLEKYSLREQMSQGDVAMIEYYLGNCERVMSSIVPDMPKEYIKNALRLADYLEEVDYFPNDINIRMCQWVLAYVIPPKVVRYVGFMYQRTTLAAVTYILLYLGLPHLAALVTSVESISSDGLVISYKVTRREMPQEYIAKLDEYYPLKPKSKEATNMAIIAINNFYALVNNSVFKVVGDQHLNDLLLERGVLNKHYRHSVRAETPIDLAKMIIMINELGEKMNKEI